MPGIESRRGGSCVRGVCRARRACQCATPPAGPVERGIPDRVARSRHDRLDGSSRSTRRTQVARCRRGHPAPGGRRMLDHGASEPGGADPVRDPVAGHQRARQRRAVRDRGADPGGIRLVVGHRGLRAQRPHDDRRSVGRRRGQPRRGCHGQRGRDGLSAAGDAGRRDGRFDRPGPRPQRPAHRRGRTGPPTRGEPRLLVPREQLVPETRPRGCRSRPWASSRTARSRSAGS